MGRREFEIANTVVVDAEEQEVWRQVTQVDIASFPHPTYLRLLDVPKPLRAEVTTEGIGGARIAYFANGLRFSQEILEWHPPYRYRFTFCPDPGFRVGWVLNLRDGPFQMLSGAYDIVRQDGVTMLSLRSRYALIGFSGRLLKYPVSAVVSLFQRYLLNGIRRNAEGHSGRPVGRA